jgi:type IX secretion system PorP/SprF family membrane protein
MNQSIHSTIAIILILISPMVHAQDVHLSHIHASPTFLNPAMTGLMNQDVRFIANYRSQWESITNGFRTMIGSADAKLLYVGENDFIGGGLQIFSDKAGDLGLSRTSVAGQISFVKALDSRGDNLLAIGIQNAFMSNHIDFSKIQANDPEPSILDGAGNSNTVWDLSLGFAWFYWADDHKYYYLGGSVYHMTRPYISFFDQGTATTEAFLYRKIVLHGGADFRVASGLYLKPSFIFLDQGPHREFNIGSFAQLTREPTRGSQYVNDYSIYFGLWFRWYFEEQTLDRDALIATVRYDWKNTIISLSFDFTVSSLGKANKGFGGPELSVIQYLDWNRTRKVGRVRCPSF